MRHLFLIILIALLPLRGWGSDAMATGMLATQVQQTATKIIADHAHEAGTQAHFDPETVVAEAAWTAADCAGHASGGKTHAADTHCESCSVCQACHSVALSPTAADVTAAFKLHTLPRTEVAQFASAETALGQKPPIS
ncbi:MAG: hypothetical protein Q8K05_11255 [Polaromonas sp.]|uniref:hypothetical protein n=1 Tax=Polaromonas sp. TaxID=1869339 RepID=UPI0027312E4D|nr:hypothetical protein [Polaromonas sp.]MDP2256615.1 hypothetical protein [Polaromonas sp.]